MSAPAALTGLLASFGDHLWQSTLVVLLIAVLATACRRNRAHVRYGLWLIGSVKFFVPFSVLVALGRRLDWPAASMPAPQLAWPAGVITEPFSAPAAALGTIAATPAAGVDRVALVPVVLLVVWAAGAAALLLAWYARWRRVGAIVSSGTPMTGGREVRLLREIERRSGHARPIQMVMSETSLEPGVFGLLRPVLLWPRGISAHLDDSQIQSILAHELAHVRRRDNLVFALHMAVQAVYWFHPLVWWLGQRLVEERERAADEDVIMLGGDPEAYAEGLLKTVRFQVESPLACVAGVTGADLERRIEQIMRNDGVRFLTARRKLLLAGAGVAVFVAPVLAGALTPGATTGQSAPAPTPEPLAFEVASIKVNESGQQVFSVRGSPSGHYSAGNLTLARLIRGAYGLQPSQLVGGPEWLDRTAFDIEAKAPDGALPGQSADRLKTLLAERFQLKVHTETRELPVYTLVVARSDGRLGPSLQVTPESECPAVRTAPSGPPPGPNQPPACGTLRFGAGTFLARGALIDQLVRTLSDLPVLTNIDRLVLNRTGLTGRYTIDLKWTFVPPPGRAAGPGGPPPVPPGEEVTVFTALQEQLGLKLEPARAPIEALVVDSAELPTEK
jgi:uncharacterized protein (TIGR03435 family)